MSELIRQQLLNNSALDWLLALGVTVVTLISACFIRKFVSNRLDKFANSSTNKLDDMFAELVRNTNGALLLIGSVLVGSSLLSLPEHYLVILKLAFSVALFFQFGLWGSYLASYYINRRLKAGGNDDPSSATAYGLLSFLSRVLVWSLVGLLILDNLGVDITALVAGLGVGGIAVALAVQNVLGDLLSSLSIVLDKPFEVGDFIIVDDFMGTVERIGVKTTRIKSLSGEQLVFSNSDLLGSRIRNYKRMQERRVVFGLGVTYQTPYEKLERIPAIIQEIVENQEAVRFDRAHFKNYGDFSLNFEVVYYVLSSDYNQYMNTQQAINLAIYKAFSELGVEFAYPTQTLFLEKEGS